MLIVTIAARVPRENPGLRPQRKPVAPGRRDRGQQVEVGSLQRPGNRLSGGLPPLTVGLVVLHDHRALVKRTRISERKQPDARQVSVEHQSSATERTICDNDVEIADPVVYDLVPVHDSQRIGSSVAAALKAKDEMIGLQPFSCFTRRLIVRRVQRRNCVARDIGNYVGRRYRT